MIGAVNTPGGEVGMHITDVVDASLAANLPTMADGAVYVVTTAGTFENSALIIPNGYYFDIGDKIVGSLAVNKWYAVEGSAIQALVDINGGTIDGTAIGSSVLSTVKGSTISTGLAAATSRLDISGVAIAADGSVSDINIDLTPKGTGEVNIPKVDIDGGAIDGTNITVGSGKTLDVSAGTLTLAADQISGDKVEGGTINAITINTLTSPSIVTADNASTQTLNIPVTGTDSSTHTISLQIDGVAGISVAATGVAGVAGVKTIDIGTTAEANVVHIGGSTALVDITDAHWSITEAGVLSIVSMGANWTNAGRTVADAGTLTTADINGGSIDGTTIGGSTPAVGTFTTANATTFDTNVAAAGVTLSGTTLAADGTDANISITISPKGVGGAVNLSRVDIDAGAIDGTPIGANSASTGAFSTLTAGGNTISLSVIQAQAIKYAIALGG